MSSKSLGQRCVYPAIDRVLPCLHKNFYAIVTPMSCVVFTGGGTGGHIFPGIAVAEVFRAETNIPILWIGSKNKTDCTYVQAAGIPFYGIPSGKLRRYFSFQNFIDLFKVAAGFIVSFVLFLRLKPLFVFSKGGFVSVPPCIAAWWLRIPVITHECDVSPGLATRINTRFAQTVLLSYPETAAFFSSKLKKKTHCTGNPVRLAFYNGNSSVGKTFIGYTGEKPVLFIQGGSLGAQQINTLVEKTIAFLTEHFFVVHQTGSKNAADGEKIRAALQKSAPQYADSYRFFPFIGAEMPHVLTCADVVVSRAGANSLWEAAAAGKPLLLLPLGTGSSRGDQAENAAFFARYGAATILSSDEANPETFRNMLHHFMSEPALLPAMAQASKALAQDKPAITIAALLQKWIPS